MTLAPLSCMGIARMRWPTFKQTARCRWQGAAWANIYLCLFYNMAHCINHTLRIRRNNTLRIFWCTLYVYCAAWPLLSEIHIVCQSYIHCKCTSQQKIENMPTNMISPFCSRAAYAIKPVLISLKSHCTNYIVWEKHAASQHTQKGRANPWRWSRPPSFCHSWLCLARDSFMLLAFFVFQELTTYLKQWCCKVSAEQLRWWISIHYCNRTPMFDILMMALFAFSG